MKPRTLITISSWVVGAQNGDNDAIRETYVKEIVNYPNLDYKFFIGDGTPISDEDERRLEPSIDQAKRCRHRLKVLSTRTQAPFTYTPKSDEVVVPCPDGYLYLGHKTRHSHKWALDHGYEFIFQCFPDTFIDIPKLMESGFEQYDCTGFLNSGKDVNAPKRYPFGGSGYWLSKRATELLLEGSVTHWAEDWLTGWILSKSDLQFHHDPRYSDQQPYVDNDLITRHLCDSPKVYDNQLMREAYRESKMLTAGAYARSKYSKRDSGGVRRPVQGMGMVRDWRSGVA